MKGMSLIVRKVTQLMAGLVFLYGIYIAVHGHLTPGGGFAGGTIIAGSFILLTVANGITIISLKREKDQSSVLESFGILAFLCISCISLVLAIPVFFRNFLPHGTAGNLVSAGVLPIYNLVVAVEVAAGLLSIFLAFIIFKAED